MTSPTELHASARSYTPGLLAIYDYLVLGFANSYAWRCPTSTVLPFFFVRYAGRAAHLDVGVGTGYYLANSMHLLSDTKITLADMNPNTLEVTTHRLVEAGGKKANIHGMVLDVFTPLPQDSDLLGTQDAVSLFFLLHCLPGPMSKKAPLVLKHLSKALKPDGTLYGATVLGKPAPGWWLGRKWLSFVNGKGDFDNSADGEKELRVALEEFFEEVEVIVVGAVALFVGKKVRGKC